jgi:hypothetical protein
LPSSLRMPGWARRLLCSSLAFHCVRKSGSLLVHSGWHYTERQKGLCFLLFEVMVRIVFLVLR